MRPISLILGRPIKHIKVLLAVRPNLENTRHVAAAVAIVGRGPDGREFIVVEDRETFHAELVRAEDVDHVVRVEELVDDLGAKSVARTSAHREDAASSVSSDGWAEFKEIRDLVFRWLGSPRRYRKLFLVRIWI